MSPRAMEALAESKARIPVFIEGLPNLLRLLADPCTAYTPKELCYRIEYIGWGPCVPTLLSELRGNDPIVKQLVLDILCEAYTLIGKQAVEPFLESVEQLLHDDNIGTRSAAVYTVCDLKITTPTAIARLREIACYDKPLISQRALLLLIEQNDEFVHEVVQLLRGRAGCTSTKGSG